MNPASGCLTAEPEIALEVNRKAFKKAAGYVAAFVATAAACSYA